MNPPYGSGAVPGVWAWLILGILHLSYVGMGMLLLDLPTWQDRSGLRRRDTWQMSCCYFTGLTAHIILLYLAALTVGVRPWMVYLLGTVGLSGFVTRIRGGAEEPVSSGGPTRSRDRVLVLLWLGVAAVPLLYVAATIVTLPAVGYDSTAIWYPKALHLHGGGSVWSAYFTDPGLVHPHPSYPLFLPLFIAGQLSAPGIAGDFLVKPGVLYLYVMGFLAVFGALRRHLASHHALAALALLLYAPFLGPAAGSGPTVSLYADFPLAIAILMTVVGLSGYLATGRIQDLWGATAGLVMAVLLKDEGSAWLFSVFVVLLAAYRYSDLREPVRGVLRVLWLPGLVAVVLIAVRLYLPAGSDLGPPDAEMLLALPGAALRVAGAWLWDLVNPWRWGVLFTTVLLLTGAGLLGGAPKGWGWVLLMILLQWLVYVTAMALLDLQGAGANYYRGATWDRLALHLVPSLLAAATAFHAPSRTPG
ncbi:MAG: hypothetical protein R6W82_01360 [bacterium]